MLYDRSDRQPPARGPKSPRGPAAGQEGLDMVRTREASCGGAMRATIVLEDVELARSQGWRAEGEAE